ncbi:hypothetical protein [Candidatus Clostridium radicumherbarum]|uniref:Uncharacterized protein n=1 Tax=Candidatus Clostridium radicumherbarum TaxID=3381662 RepID=A0ABW8TYW5_9CLOT
MSKNNLMAKRILNFKSNLQNNTKMLSVDIKLASNQKDDAQRVKDYVNERVGTTKKIAL